MLTLGPQVRSSMAAEVIAHEQDPSKDSKATEEAEGDGLPYPTIAPVVFFYLNQESRPRSWCLRIVCNPYPFIEPR